ncbi:MAG TPA: zinc-dependent alcohol dehydrogenase family protein [Casimicrobiaceae bacterium]
MRAMVLDAARTPLRLATTGVPRPAPSQVLVRVHACGVCRTDLHVVDGDLTAARHPIIPGHEIVGIVADAGSGVHEWRIGDRVGIPWLACTCGRCRYCTSGRENLCDAARFTGYTVDGGYAEYAIADARFCFRMPAGFSDEELAPWLCAGLIGYRALRMAGDAARIGIYGFGAAAHLVTQVARHQGRDVYAFTRPGDVAAQSLARGLGVAWAGGSDEPAPEALDAALLFAPVGALVPKALRDVAKGGSVVCAGIHMSDIPSFPYAILWGERRLASVANLTRRDGEEFIALAQRVPIRTSLVTFPLAEANAALAALRDGTLAGTAVLTMA